MNKARKNYIKSCEVSELITPTLGGFKQKVLVEGRNKNLPVVICLHGGPGSPVPFSVGCRGLFPDWTDKAVMVYWDQLGCGANNHIIDDSFNIGSFVKMTVDLVSKIKTMFPENRLYLFGLSWGSVLALETAVRVPEKLDGVLVYGQVLKNLFFNEEVASAFASAPKKAKLTVQKIIDTGFDCEYEVLDKNLKMLNKLLSKHTNGYFNKNAKRISVMKIVEGLMTSPDYSSKDFKAVMKNGYRYNKTLWTELFNTDLSPLLSELKIKYLILQGDTDIVTSTKTVKEAVQNSNNENVTVKVVKNSGHMPSEPAMDECFQTLLQFIK